MKNYTEFGKLYEKYKKENPMQSVASSAIEEVITLRKQVKEMQENIDALCDRLEELENVNY
jgi:archaellum component FlaC